MSKIVKRIAVWSLMLCLCSGALCMAWAEDGDPPPIDWNWLENRGAQSDQQTPSAMGSIAAGLYHSVGLKSDGTVVAAGDNRYGQCDVSGWKNIVAIAAGERHTVGLKSDGTVVATGDNEDGQCDVSGWKDIVAVAAGDYRTVGLKSDGTVVATGNKANIQYNVSRWKDIVAFTANDWYAVGLKSDGTVVAAGYDDHGKSNVTRWEDIVAIATNDWHTFGLKGDGTVVATEYDADDRSDVSGWKDIVAIAAGGVYCLGLKSDGTVVATGYSQFGQCDVSDWQLKAGSMPMSMSKPTTTMLTADSLRQNQYRHIIAGTGYSAAIDSDGQILIAGQVPIDDKPNGMEEKELEQIKQLKNVIALEKQLKGNRLYCLYSEGTSICSSIQGLEQEEKPGNIISAIECNYSRGNLYTVLLYDNGTVYTDSGEKMNVDNVVAIADCADVIACLCQDGKVVCFNHEMNQVPSGNTYYELTLQEKIVSVKGAPPGAIALRADGTVYVRVCDSSYLRNPETEEWSDIIAVDSNGEIAAGIKRDGSVVVAPLVEDGERYIKEYGIDTSSWTDIVEISVGFYHILGLKSDGTVVATGSNECGECNVKGWSNIGGF